MSYRYLSSIDNVRFLFSLPLFTWTLPKPYYLFSLSPVCEDPEAGGGGGKPQRTPQAEVCPPAGEPGAQNQHQWHRKTARLIWWAPRLSSKKSSSHLVSATIILEKQLVSFGERHDYPRKTVRLIRWAPRLSSKSKPSPILNFPLFSSLFTTF